MDESEKFITPGSDESVVSSAANSSGNPARRAFGAEYNPLGIKTNLAIPLTQVSSGNNAGMKSVVGSSEPQTTQTPVSSSGNVQSSNSIGYNSGVGWWMGFDKGMPKFFLGNSAGNKVTWDGTSLSITGEISASSLDIPDTTSANSFHVDSQGNTWWGANLATGYAGAPARVLNTGAAAFSNVAISGGSITTTPISGIPNNSSTDISLLEFTQNLAFTSASATQANWSSGTITLSNGRTFSIVSGNTGTMAALTYIYLDPATSSTILQKTTTFSTAIGANKILIAVAQNNATAASIITYGGGQPVLDGAGQIAALSITAGSIAAGSITAAKINVTQLSAITADMGTLTAGTITLPSGGFVRSGQTTYDTGTGWFIGNPSGTPQLSIGNSAGQKLTWDGTTLSLVGNLTVGNVLTAAETVSAGNACAMGFYQSDGGVLIDTSSSSNGNTTAGTLTISLTVGNNSNRILTVFVARGPSFGITPPSVAYNGVSMTNISSRIIGGAGAAYIHAYALIAPATGTHNLTVSTGASDNLSVAIYSYYNAKQTSNPAVFPTTNATSAGSVSQTLTSVAAGGVIVSAALSGNTPGTRTFSNMNASPQTVNGSLGTGGTFTFASGDSYLIGAIVPVSPAANSTVAQDWALSSVSIEAFTAVSYRVYKASAAAASSYGWNLPYKSTVFLGFAYSASTLGNPITVVVSGIAPGLSGLTPLSDYYLADTAGTISITPGTVTRKVGISTDASNLTITNIW